MSKITVEIRTLKNWPSYGKYPCVMSKIHCSHFAVHLNEGNKVTYLEAGVSRRGAAPDEGDEVLPTVFDIACNPGAEFKYLRRGFTNLLSESLMNDFVAWSDLVIKLRKSGMDIPEGAENMTFEDFVQDRLEARREANEWQAKQAKQTPKHA